MEVVRTEFLDDLFYLIRLAFFLLVYFLIFSFPPSLSHAIPPGPFPLPPPPAPSPFPSSPPLNTPPFSIRRSTAIHRYHRTVPDPRFVIFNCPTYFPLLFSFRFCPAVFTNASPPTCLSTDPNPYFTTHAVAPPTTDPVPRA